MTFPFTDDDDKSKNIITEIVDFSIRDSDMHFQVKTTHNPRPHWINTNPKGTGYVDIQCQLEFLQNPHNWTKVSQDIRVKKFVEKSCISPKPKHKRGALVYFERELFEVSGMLTFENFNPVSINSSISSKDFLAMHFARVSFSVDKATANPVSIFGDW